MVPWIESPTHIPYYGSVIAIKLHTDFLHNDHVSYPSLDSQQQKLISSQAQAGQLSSENEKIHHYKPYSRKGELTALVASLRTCANKKDLCNGIRIHDDISRRGLLKKCCDALVIMYAKCGALAKAKELLETCESRNLVAWTAVIAGYTQHGQHHDALNCFQQMQCMGISPDAVAFACTLKSCGSIGAADKGKQIHEEISKQGLLGNDIVLGNCLVDMYAKCGDLTKAQQVLQELVSRDVVTWNALITAYSQHDQSKQVLQCFKQMQHEGVSPTAITFASVLKACGHIGAVDMGAQIHDKICAQELLQDNVVLGTALVDMYAKCGALSKARQVLEELPTRNVVSWSALISAYADHGKSEQALSCFEQMQHEAISPDAVNFACILKICGQIGAFDKGEQVHNEILRQGMLGNDSVLATALVDMYAKCGDLAKARRVLEDLATVEVVSWNALLAGYVQHNQNEEALSCLALMQDKGLSLDSLTCACALKACASIGAADKAEKIHGWIIRQGFLYKDVVLGTALMDMYAKCGSINRAAQAHEELSSKDIISWNALIAGYVKHGHGAEALECFERMKCDGFSPNAVTFASILKACGILGALDMGAEIHEEIAKQGLMGCDSVLATSIVDMYAKCGNFVKAREVIKILPSPDIASWNALLAGYAQHGQAEQALLCFEQMQQDDIFPDTITLACVLNACSHLGLVEESHMLFTSMRMRYGLKPGLEHFTCMVDLLGRSGNLDKAVGMIDDLQSSDNSAIWSALLGACLKWGDINVGKWAFEQAIKVDKGNASVYIVMANIYAAVGKYEDVKNINLLRLQSRVD